MEDPCAYLRREPGEVSHPTTPLRGAFVRPAIRNSFGSLRRTDWDEIDTVVRIHPVRFAVDPHTNPIKVNLIGGSRGWNESPRLLQRTPRGEDREESSRTAPTERLARPWLIGAELPVEHERTSVISSPTGTGRSIPGIVRSKSIPSIRGGNLGLDDRAGHAGRSRWGASRRAALSRLHRRSDGPLTFPAPRHRAADARLTRRRSDDQAPEQADTCSIRTRSAARRRT
jgi:hypothetical protein